MVTNSSRILHHIALVIGERLIQIPNPKILGSDFDSQVGLRCPFLDQLIIDKESESQHNNTNCVDGRGGGQLPDYGC